MNKDEIEMKEALDEADKEVKKPFTNAEAPMSVTIQSYYKGFSVLITKRDPDAAVAPLIKQSMEAIDYMKKLGFKPSWNAQTNAELDDDKATTPKDTTPPPISRPGASGVTTNDNGEPLPWEGKETAVDNPGWCTIHKLNMKERQGQYGKFWSHARRLGAGYEYCNGHSFPSERPKI